MIAIKQHGKHRKIKGINKIGLLTLVKKECLRFFSVYFQTIFAPVITTVMFYTIFALAFGGQGRNAVGDVSFLEFLAPGLIIMTMVQNAFANSSSTLVVSKVQGNIVDILMPPLSSLELLIGLLSGSIVRAAVIGMASAIALFFIAPIHISALWAIICFAFLGSTMLACIGLAAGLWAEKFDHIAAVTNFVVTPMTFLSGTFYSVSTLPQAWQVAAYVNPFFYIIDGFRYGFIGQSDGNITTGIIILLLCNMALIGLNYTLIKIGYKIKT
ncbi:MAG: ABC transporter permease [Alphaproteobacteria bacterium]